MYHFYPHVYWQCAVLTVNASANEENDDNKSTNYGKTANAVSTMKSQGVNIALPDINKARFGFSPDAKMNQIIFGLKAISGCGDDDATQIIENRPYASLIDFLNKNSNLGKVTVIALIKAGCFDVLENKNRVDIMRDYVRYVARKDNPPKEKLNMQNFKSIMALNLLGSRFDLEKRLFGFRSYVFSKNFMIDKDTYHCDRTAQIFFENTLYKFFREGQDYIYQDDKLLLYKKPFEKFYKEQIKDMVAYIATPEFVQTYNGEAIQTACEEIWNKYCLGSISKWEMDSLCFYHTRHELADVNHEMYGLSAFSQIPEDPVVIGTNTRKIKDRATGEEKITTWDKYKLYRIAGTVLDKNKNKHMLTLLTTDGVVTVKFYAEAFAFYDRQISQIDENGDKTVLEKSWFTRGNKLIITGIRRGDTFYPKKYQDSIYQHTVCLIEDVYSTGQMSIQTERKRNEPIK